MKPKTDVMRIMGWAIPILCMAIACWVVIKQNVAFQTASAARDQANRDVEQAAKEKRDTENLPVEIRYAAVEDQPNEEAQFLDFLRKRAAVNDVKLANWSSQNTEFGKDKPQGPAIDDKTIALLKGIQKRSSTLSLIGPYSGLRNLVGDLVASARLYTLNNVIWNRTEQGTTLHMSVSRYVEPPKPPETKKAPGMTISQ